MKLQPGLELVGRVVCIAEPRGLLCRLMRWLYEAEITAANQGSQEFVAAADGKHVAVTWQPQR